MFNVQTALHTADSRAIDLSKAPGVILYEGPSKLDGQPIVVIATGLAKASRNAKTGAMVQTYILRRDMHPIEAVRSGADASICGTCPHRGDGTGQGRSCYVTLAHGPSTVYKAYLRGVYPKANAFQAAALFAGKMVRLGTYGDPAAAPLALWKVALTSAEGWTGYTHQWRTISPEFAALVMASADSVEDMNAAHALGFRTFRVTAAPFANIKGREAVCPASEEKGKVASCITCRACMGTSGKAKASIQIAAHGGGKKHVQ
jgi:hypothetical protein